MLHVAVKAVASPCVRTGSPQSSLLEKKTIGRIAPRVGTLIFSHIRRLGLFFGFKILNFNIPLGFSEK